MPSALQTTDDLKGDLLSVKMMGVSPDGLTDNYVSLQVAINAASSLGSPILMFPVGTYKVKVPVNGVITIPAGLQLVGDYGSEVLMVDDGNAGNRCLFKFNGDNSGIRNLSITAQISVVPVGQNGVDIIQIGNANNTSVSGCVLNGSRDSSFQNTNGIQFIGNANGVEITGCTFEQLWYGFYRANSNTNTQRNIRVIGNKFYRNFGDDANFNCPGNNGGENTITVVGNSFSDNQSNTPVGGFAVDFANCQYAAVCGNTIANYQREGIHIEFSSFVTVEGNTLTNVGSVDFGGIHIIATSHHLSITGNTVDCSTNTVSDFGIDVQPGGAGTCLQVVVSDNIVNVSSTMTGIFLEGSTDIVVKGNVVTGPGIVSGGSYTGGSNVGIDIAGLVRAVVSSNLVEGFGYGIGSSSTMAQIGDFATISDNEVYGCNVGLALKASGSLVISDNLMNNCVSPTAFGMTSVAPKISSFIGNKAVGCVNRIDYYDNMSATQNIIALNDDDVSGATIGSTTIKGGFGNTTLFPTDVVVGAGGSGSNAGSITFGEGTGFRLVFGTRITGSFVPQLYIDDLGNMIYTGSTPGGGEVAFKSAQFTNLTVLGNQILLGSVPEQIDSGTGNPNGVVTAPGGSVFLDSGGNVWLKLSGTGNTGWYPGVGVNNSAAGVPARWSGSGLPTLDQGPINLASADVTGTLPVGHGGTAATTFANIGFVTTPGGTGALGSLAYGTSGSFQGVNTFGTSSAITSVDFTHQTTTSATFVSSLSVVTYTYGDGLITNP